MALKDKVIVTCALTGAVTTKKQCEAIPYTALEIAEEARRAWEAGAAVVHIHGREDNGQPSYRKEVFAAYRDEIRKRCPIILNFSTGAVGLPMQERVGHIVECKPEIGALNAGSLTYAKYSQKRKQFVFDFVFGNPFSDITYLLRQMNEVGVRPECELFDTGHVENLEPLIDMGLLKPPCDVNLVMGVLGGMRATPETLSFIVSQLRPGTLWKTTPISHMTWPLTAAALALGGNVRVGLEDNFYLPDRRMVKSNGELVAQATAMARAIGREPASVDEAKKMLGLGAAA
ncbi:MAG TPA: 3-keto-5-aminohexanoate cleavage protein [Polyangia bacterium]|nr:3-keto-5-aminohexanoate cleavage protein [Polyangia bacterium]